MSDTTSHKGCPNCGFGAPPETYEGEKTLSSRVIELLRSNDPPRESELAQMHAATAHHTARLSSLDLQISQLQNMLKHLETERQRIAGTVDELRLVSSPCRRLPDDILSEVFLACIDNSEDFEMNFEKVDSLDVTHMPWVLARVCSRWRAVTVSFPQLWSSICLKLDRKRGNRNVIGSVLLLGVHLQRSTSRNLNVELESAKAVKENNVLLQVLLPTSHRWQYAALIMPQDSLKALKPIQGSLQSLRSLYLELEPPPMEASHVGTGALGIFDYAAQLQVVYFNDVNRPLDLSLPWSQLTVYHWGMVGGQKCTPQHLEVLRQTPNMKRCTLDCSWPPEHQAGPPVTLPKLRYLGIQADSSCDSPFYSQLVQNLILPVLNTFDLQLCHDLDVDSILSLISRSGCTLTCYNLDFPKLTGGQLLQLLRAAPSLRELNLLNIGSGECFSDDVVAQLIYRPGHLIPMLEVLVLPTLTCNHAFFVDLVESRCFLSSDMAPEGSAFLCSVKIAAPVDFNPGLLSRLEKCVLDGLKFVNGE